jgi:hypothetical protein
MHLRCMASRAGTGRKQAAPTLLFPRGGDLHSEIDAALQAADVILLLVSPDLSDSYYCYDVEVRAAKGPGFMLARHV